MEDESINLILETPEDEVKEKVVDKTEPKAEDKAEPKAEDKAEPETEEKAEDKAEPKAEVKAEPETEEKAEDKAEPKVEDKAEPKPSTGNQVFQKFLQELEAKSETGDKLQFTINFMESSIAQTGSPHFKNFWEAKKICMDLFKNELPPALRSILWEKYLELSLEIKRLKEIYDSESAFAAEQIETAIKAIEDDMAKGVDEDGEKSLFSNLPRTDAFVENLACYKVKQNELNFFNCIATRINSLRKELMKTEIRMKKKNQFFARLSTVGDSVFPKRKELIKEVSDQFLLDINSFVKKNFGSEELQGNVSFLRDEIKNLQSFAKILTLNNQSFHQTRLLLSECWEKIKTCDKEFKKQRAEMKGVFIKNAEEITLKIIELKTLFESNSQTIAQTKDGIDEIFALMKKTELGRDEVRTLRDELQVIKKLIFAKENEEELKQKQILLDKQKKKKEQFELVEKAIADLFSNSSKLDIDHIETEQKRLLSEISILSATKYEKHQLESSLKPIKDTIAEKREQALLALSDDDLQKLDQLKQVLKDREARRQEIKDQVEVYRKAKGSSGLDFEKAMSFSTLENEEKERLSSIVESIKETKNKIAVLEKKSLCEKSQSS